MCTAPHTGEDEADFDAALTDPHEKTFYLTHAPGGTPLCDLVRIAGQRWTIESNFEQAKSLPRT